jgi:hypothetical protein
VAAPPDPSEPLRRADLAGGGGLVGAGLVGGWVGAGLVGAALVGGVLFGAGFAGAGTAASVGVGPDEVVSAGFDNAAPAGWAGIGDGVEAAALAGRDSGDGSGVFAVMYPSWVPGPLWITVTQAVKALYSNDVAAGGATDGVRSRTHDQGRIRYDAPAGRADRTGRADRPHRPAAPAHRSDR